jgi:hypothetical protein
VGRIGVVSTLVSPSLRPARYRARTDPRLHAIQPQSHQPLQDHLAQQCGEPPHALGIGTRQGSAQGRHIRQPGRSGPSITLRSIAAASSGLRSLCAVRALGGPRGDWALIREALQRGQLTGNARFIDEVAAILGQRIEHRKPRRPPGGRKINPSPLPLLCRWPNRSEQKGVSHSSVPDCYRA